jgi:CCR4-NOT transcription complex subunit 2
MAQRATHREVNPSEEAFFGLQGLVDLIQHRKRDVSTLRLGIDLGSLGLDLNSSEPLHRSMKSPFTSRDRASSSSSGGKSSKEEEEEEDSFSLPACYSFKPPRLQLEHFGSFPIQTLLYVFYSLPQETIQAIAAQELYRRGLKYHDRLRAWFTRKEVKNTFQIFKFDVEDWQMKPFPIGSEQEERKLVEGFLSEDDVRVRMPPPPTSQQQPQQPQQQPQQPSQPNASSGSSTGK